MNVINFIKKVFRYILYRATLFFHKVIVMANLYEQDLSSIPGDLHPKIRGIFKVIEIGSDFDIFKDNFSSSHCEICKERLSKYHDRMVAFIVDGKLAYWGWFTFGRNRYYEPEIGHEIAVQEEAAYYFDGHTTKNYQRKGIYAASYSYLSTFLMNIDKKKIKFTILTHNKASIANAKKYDHRIIQKLVLLNFGILKLKFRLNKR